MLVELAHEAYRATQKLKFGMNACDERRMLQLNQLDKFRLKAYIIAMLYKECSKLWHDKLILPWSFEQGHQVLLYNSRLKLFLGKLFLGKLKSV